jgi:hypothetical protein
MFVLSGAVKSQIPFNILLIEIVIGTQLSFNKILLLRHIRKSVLQKWVIHDSSERN